MCEHALRKPTVSLYAVKNSLNYFKLTHLVSTRIHNDHFAANYSLFTILANKWNIKSDWPGCQFISEVYCRFEFFLVLTSVADIVFLTTLLVEIDSRRNT